MAVRTWLDQETLAAAAQEWQLGDLRASKGLAEGSVDTLYRLDTTAGRFLLRVSERGDRDAVGNEMTLLRFLGAENFPAVQPMPLSDGSFVGELAGKPVVVLRWGKGRHVPAWELGRRQLADSGRLLARLHQLGEGVVEPSTDGFTPDRLRKQIEAVVEESSRARRRDDASLQQVVPLLQREAAMLEHLPPVPSGLVHGDWFPDNLLFEGDNVSAVLDFEKADYGPFLLDLMSALHAACFDSDFVWTRAQALVSGYSTVRALTAEERESLHGYARYSALRYVVSRLQDFHLSDLPESRLQRKDWRRFRDRLTRTLEMGPGIFLQMCGLRSGK